MSKVCAKHRAEPVTIYRQCVGCEIEGQRVALQEWGEKTDWFRRGIARGVLPASYLGKHIAEAMSEEILMLREMIVDIVSEAGDTLNSKPKLLQAANHILGSREAQQ